MTPPFTVNASNHADLLLRQTRAHHVQLSAMADVKASMLITMASIVLTLAVPRVMQPGSHLPMLALMGFCLLTILLAAFAAMPKLRVHLEHVSPQERASPRFNILFFGDFTGLTYEEFETEMVPLLTEPQRSYQAQLREIYSLGTYLARRKYRFLRLAYFAFMAGLVSSSILLIFFGYR